MSTDLDRSSESGAAALPVPVVKQITPNPNAPPARQPALPPTTTYQEDLTTAGQRRVNLIWEYTQAAIALAVVFATMLAGLRSSGDVPIPTILSVAFGTVVGFYFSRTNHAAIGGVGPKPELQPRVQGPMTTKLDAVVDLSHWNASVNFEKVREAGILGVILKCTQGTGAVDPTYRRRRDAAREAGLLVGAYHFGTYALGRDQADFFLAVANDSPEVLCALDYEDNPVGKTMTHAQALDFVERVNEVTGRYPGFYSGHAIKRVLGDTRSEVLSRCWLWLAQYGSAATVQPTWPTWTMWQYRDDGKVDGITGPVDRNRFNGDEAGLRRLWGAGL